MTKLAFKHVRCPLSVYFTEGIILFKMITGPSLTDARQILIHNSCAMSFARRGTTMFTTVAEAHTGLLLRTIHILRQDVVSSQVDVRKERVHVALLHGDMFLEAQVLAAGREHRARQQCDRLGSLGV